MKYLNFKFNVDIDFASGTTTPSVVGDSNVVFDTLSAEVYYGTCYMYIRPHVTVGAEVYNIKLTLNNELLSDVSSAIVPSAAFSDGGHAAFSNTDIHDSLTAESIVNTYDEYPSYNSYYGSYNFQVNMNASGYITPDFSGTTTLTVEIRYQFDENEESLYNALLALYPNNVKRWAPGQTDSKIYKGDINVNKIYCGNVAVSAVYVGDTQLFPE
jgi:hypothetical protein